MKITITKEYDIQKVVSVSCCRLCPCFNGDAERTENKCQLGFGGDYDEMGRGCPLREDNDGSILITREED